MAAEGGAIRAGEHDGFTRIVLTVDPTTEWSLETAEGHAALRFPGRPLAFATAGVFDKIPQTRVTASRHARPRRHAVTVALGCDCRVSASFVGAQYLALDVADRDARPAAAAPPPAPDETAEARATREATVVASAEQALIRQIERAASQGIVRFSDPEDPPAPGDEAGQVAARPSAPEPDPPPIPGPVHARTSTPPRRPTASSPRWPAATRSSRPPSTTATAATPFAGAAATPEVCLEDAPPRRRAPGPTASRSPRSFPSSTASSSASSTRRTPRPCSTSRGSTSASDSAPRPRRSSPPSRRRRSRTAPFSSTSPARSRDGPSPPGGPLSARRRLPRQPRPLAGARRRRAGPPRRRDLRRRRRPPSPPCPPTCASSSAPGLIGRLLDAGRVRRGAADRATPPLRPGETSDAGARSRGRAARWPPKGVPRRRSARSTPCSRPAAMPPSRRSTELARSRRRRRGSRPRPDRHRPARRRAAVPRRPAGSPPAHAFSSSRWRSRAELPARAGRDPRGRGATCPTPPPPSTR